ncbi:hypothetical protein IU405_07230 [Polaribacter sp. BAL334]|jgi:hypothetical protein|uniref:hypothetical protein n=1 Tax=Polaribacter sp. BAL334 TaxID=1708178 RepID=UPI0018D222F1|nr:hypothetical protein [Polaribacter sp. BAL334]MBG7612038.1 hypothetical protein [Polaribacter sp. BAL334]MDP5093859.1 hypothetical protein [Polaribacter sp.]
MDIQLEKYKLIEWLTSVNDESIINTLKNIKSNFSDTDNWEISISETEKILIEKGLKDIEAGNLISHEQVMKGIKERYNL